MEDIKYVSYHGQICILIEDKGAKSTIAGIYYYMNSFDMSVFEGDVNTSELEPVNQNDINDKSMIHRLKIYRTIHDCIFGFVDEEMELVHPFI